MNIYIRLELGCSIHLFARVIQTSKKEMANQRTQISGIPDQPDIESEHVRKKKKRKESENTQKLVFKSTLVN